MVNYVKNKKNDLINIQEVHLRNNNQIFINGLENDINGIAYVNSSHSQHGVMTLIRNDILNFKTTQINNGIDDFKNKFLFIQIQTDEIVNVTDTITRTVISNINSNKKIKGILYQIIRQKSKLHSILMTKH